MNVDDLRGKIPEDGSFKLRALHTAVKLLLEFCCHLENLSASYHIFKPVLTTLKHIDVEKYPCFLQEDIQNIILKIEEMAHKKLHFLVKEKKKPKALRLYEPRIEEVWVPSVIQVGSIYRLVMYIVKRDRLLQLYFLLLILLFYYHLFHFLIHLHTLCMGLADIFCVVTCLLYHVLGLSHTQAI